MVLTETLPANTSFSNAGSTAGWQETFPGSGVFTFNVGTVAVGSSGSVNFAVRVNSQSAGGRGDDREHGVDCGRRQQRSGPESAGQHGHGRHAGGSGSEPGGGQERPGCDVGGGWLDQLHADVHEHGQPGRDGRVPDRDAAELRHVQHGGQHAGLGGHGRRRVSFPGGRGGGGPDGQRAVCGAVAASLPAGVEQIATRP